LDWLGWTRLLWFPGGPSTRTPVTVNIFFRFFDTIALDFAL